MMDATAQAQTWLSTLSTVALLNKENQLLTAIRDLDSQRQSLVYNHHHDLVDASETITRLRNTTRDMDATLLSLRSAVSSVVKLASAVQPTIDDGKASSKRGGRSSALSDKKVISLPTVEEDEFSDGDRTLGDVDEPPKTADKPLLSNATVVTLTQLNTLLAVPVVAQYLARTDLEASQKFVSAWEPRMSEIRDVPGIDELLSDARDATQA